MNIGVMIIGLVVGVFVGISGMGGGSLLTPLLVLVFGVHTLTAVGSDLVASVPMKLAGALAHYRQRNVDGRLVWMLSAGGVPGAVIGLILLHHFQAELTNKALNTFVGRALGVALLCAAVALLVGMFLRKDKEEEEHAPFVWVPWHNAAIPAIGFVVGIVVSITSVGSGALTLPLLLMVISRLGLRRLVGSDIAFAAILIPVAAIGQWRLGSVNLPIAISLLIGSVPGVLIGSKLCAVVPPKYFRPILVGAMAFVGSRLL